MPKMTEGELLAIVKEAERDALSYNGDFIKENQDLTDYYYSEPFGDEVEGQSQVVSSDVQDLVESDMPSLARVFLGAQDVITFEHQSERDADIQEAEEKTKYVNWIIRNQKGSYKIIHDWLKDAEMQKVGVVKVSYEVKDEVREVEYDGIDQAELEQLFADLSEDAEKVEVIGQNENEDGSFYLKFRIKRVKKQFVIQNIPTEEFLISSGARSFDDAPLIGDRVVKTRGELIAEGFDKETIKKLPTHNQESEEGSGLTLARGRGQDSEADSINHWASEKVALSDLYVYVDFDGDGIPERRHILKSGEVILENESFPIHPYAGMSAIAMPHKAIGRSRAELAKQSQRIKSVLFRQTLDNIYRVNNGRTVVNDDNTNMDDLLTVRPNGVVRTKGDPLTAVAQLQTPYVGDKALQVVQYVDSLRSESTGHNMANQGLDSDQLYKESATRFRGMEEAGQAKIELVARTMAETGFARLGEVLAWMASHYQDDAKEIMVLGKTLTVDPRKWRYDHPVAVTVHKDDEAALGNLSGLLQIHQQLAAMQSPLTDHKKVFNVLERSVKAMGFSDAGQFFNDPEQPQELLYAQVIQLKIMVEQLKQQAMQNPLAEAELIRAQAKMAEVQGKESNAMRQFVMKMAQEDEHFRASLAKDLTKLELDSGVNIKGAMV